MKSSSLVIDARTLLIATRPRAVGVECNDRGPTHGETSPTIDLSLRSDSRKSGIRDLRIGIKRKVRGKMETSRNGPSGETLIASYINSVN